MWKFFTKYGEEKKLLVPSAIAYGTTLPATPIDGQEAILVDSITNPTYQWRFRYNAQSTSAYKWEYVGGTPKSFYDTTVRQNTVDSTWESLAGMISFALPRAGQYTYRFTAQFSGNNNITAYVAVGVGAALNNPALYISPGSSLAGNIIIQGAQEVSDLVNGLTRSAADLVKLYIYSSAHTNNQWMNTALAITPIRVS